MSNRLELHRCLCYILGTNHVYYQPPENIKMVYPCFVYALSNITTRHANNKLYAKKKQYTVTYIDKRPDSLIPDRMLELPYSNFDRAYASNDLNHYSFTLYN